MADFSVISEVSTELIRLLRENLCPELMQSPETITLASPADKNADYQLGLFLYDMKELSEYRSSERVRLGDNRTAFPPKPLNLFYALFLNSKAQIAAGAESEQRVLARAMQILLDHPILEMTRISAFTQTREGDAAVTLLNTGFEEKSKLWAALSMPYQLALHFNVSPVLLSSRKSTPFTHVTDVEIHLKKH